jgi:hypothetical protein
MMDAKEVLVRAAASEAFGFEDDLQQDVNFSDLLHFAELLEEAWQDRAQRPASAPSVNEELLAAITDFRKAFVIAVGEKSPFAKLALGNIDRAVQQVEASKAEKIPGEVERVTMERFIVVLGVPAHDDATHDCDAMGCGRAHVLARIPRV